MLVLALDTASVTTSVALAEAGAGFVVVASLDVADARRPAEQLAPAIAEVLATAGVSIRDVSLVAVGAGPGPFTGLRAGLVTARTLGRTLDVDVVGVVSLDAVALAARHAGSLPPEFVVATDARRREVYWAAYSGSARVAGPFVALPTDVDLAGRPVVGRGATLYPDVLGGPASTVLDPPAWAIAQLAVEAVRDRRAAAPDPLYLRRPDIAAPAPRKRVSPR